MFLKKAFAFVATALIVGATGETITLTATADKGFDCGKNFVREVTKTKEDPLAPMFKAADCGLDSFKILTLGSLASLMFSIGGGVLVASRVGNKNKPEASPQSPSIS